MYTVDLTYICEYFDWSAAFHTEYPELMMTDVFTDKIRSLVEPNEDYLMAIF